MQWRYMLAMIGLCWNLQALASDAELDALLQRTQTLKPSEKIYQFSRFFMGKPYVNGALGEGVAGSFDRVPMIRFDAFDCMTYVSTLMALVHADDTTTAQNNIRHINYQDGTIDYLKRLHFTSTDWNTENIQKGRLRDVTTLFIEKGVPLYQTSSIMLNRSAWLEKRPLDTIRIPLLNKQGQQERLNVLHSLAKALKPKLSRVHYLPLSALLDEENHLTPAFKNRLKSGLVMEIVRPKWNLTKQIGTYLQISHMGFVLYHHDRWWFHHATPTQHRVADVPLEDYLAGLKPSPTIKGIALFKVL